MQLKLYLTNEKSKRSKKWLSQRRQVLSHQAGEHQTNTRNEAAETGRIKSIELGSIHYANLTSDGRHGDYALALSIAKETGKPIFANFVELSGCQGCQDAGAYIFTNPVIQLVAESFFVPCAFNTWDRYDRNYNMAMRQWAGPLKDSDWGYLRLISSWQDYSSWYLTNYLCTPGRLGKSQESPSRCSG
ncbi:hypothetical protein ACA910_003004 [Epithemia clementina (nom. ined.)]